MRSKSEIEALLREQLTSPVWSNLKRALLGNELISFATAAISISDAGYTTFFRNLFVETADLRGLISLARLYKVPFSNFRPSYVKVQMPIVGESEVLYPPYSVVFKNDSVSYTNISYVRSSLENSPQYATLIQGNVRLMTNLETAEPLPDLGYLNVTREGVVTFNNSEFLNEEGKYLKLPETALPSSLKVFQFSPLLQPIPERDVLTENPHILNFKALRDYDNSLSVIMGNGVDGLPWTSQVLGVYYLQCTFIKYKSSSVQLHLPSDGGVEVYEPVVVSQLDGETDSLYEARLQIKAEMAKNSVIATSDQIKSYVNSQAGVLDSHVLRGDDHNQVKIYIKPENQNDSSFSGIEELLRMYGEVVTDFVVSAGTPVEFELLLSSDSSIAQQTKDEVVSELESSLDYRSIGFLLPLTPSNLTSTATSIADKPVSVAVKSSIVLDFNPLVSFPIRPEKGSVSIVKDNEIIGWDYSGFIYGFSQQTLAGFGAKSFLLGDFVFSTQSDSPLLTVVSSDLERQLRSNTDSIHLGDAYSVVKGSNYYGASFNIGGEFKYRLYKDLGEWDSSSLNSVMGSVGISVFPVYPYDGTYLESDDSQDLMENAIMVGTSLYSVRNTGTAYVLSKYVLDPEATRYTQMWSKLLKSDSIELNVVGVLKVGKYALFIFQNSSTLVVSALVFNLEDETSEPLVCDLSSVVARVNQDLVDLLFWSKVSYESDLVVVSGNVVLKYDYISIVVRSSYAVAAIPEITWKKTLPIAEGNVELLGSSPKGVFVRTPNSGSPVIRVLGDSQDLLLRSTDYIATLSQMGSVSYTQKVMKLNQGIDGVLNYRISDPFSALDSDCYPVISDIRWE